MQGLMLWYGYLILSPSSLIPVLQYIDAMYPYPKKKRLLRIRQGMQVARELVGDDADANELVEIAKKVARKRVVIKRPKFVKEDSRATRAYKSPRTRYEVFDVNTTK